LCLGALVVDKCCDYHWYRRNADVDGNITWSHKQGGMPAVEIPEPTEASHASKERYETWCGYWCVPCGDLAVRQACTSALGVATIVGEVEVFSGEPNPMWTISDVAEISQLHAMLLEVTGAPMEPPPWHPRAGFRGVSLRNEGADDAGFPYHVFVADGFVAVTSLAEGEYRTLYYHDSVGFADFLRGSATAQGLGGFFP